MSDVIVFAGTNEGRMLYEYCAGRGIDGLFCVATTYGQEVLQGAAAKQEVLQGTAAEQEVRQGAAGGQEIRTGRLTRQQMIALFIEARPRLIIDATHPFAVEATENIRAAAERYAALAGLTEQVYYRVLRETGGQQIAAVQESSQKEVRKAEPKGAQEEVQKREQKSAQEGERGGTQKKEEDNEWYFQDLSEAVVYLEGTQGNILAVTGSKEADELCKLKNFAERVYLRILPNPDMLRQCLDNGFAASHVICMQGPFTEESNLALLRQYNIRYLLTKQSGAAGGYPEKRSAARKAGAALLTIRAPRETAGVSVEEMERILGARADAGTLQTVSGAAEDAARHEDASRSCGEAAAQHKDAGRPCADAAARHEKAADSEGRAGKLYLVGTGMGNPDNLTVEARNAIERAEVVIGAARLLEPYRGRKNCIAASRTADVMAALARESRRAEPVIAVLLSGDSGFFSGARLLLERLTQGNNIDQFSQNISCTIGQVHYSVVILPGISSLSYFCARIGASWEKVSIVNLHGAEETLWQAALTHEKVFAVTGGNLKAQLQRLVDLGLGERFMGCAGENLSYADERIVRGSAAQLAEYDYGDLAVLYLENDAPLGSNLTGLPDDCFLRGGAPMTKAEVRAYVMSRLRLRRRDIVYDVGAGTGSVTVEMALAAPQGRVYAIDNDEEALRLCRENQERFGLHNIEIVAGTAPEIFRELPVPDAVFIGGSKGHLEEIVGWLVSCNPAIRLVITAVTVETAQQALALLEKGGFGQIEAVQIQANRIRRVGNSHMTSAQNPVTVISAVGTGVGRLQTETAERTDSARVARQSGGTETAGRTDDTRAARQSGGTETAGHTDSAGTAWQSGNPGGVLIAGAASGSGKTTLVCGLLTLFKRRGIDVGAFKCGPDYIDPSLHAAITGSPSYQLDSFFTGEERLRELYAEHAMTHSVNIVEGVMGFYDGIGFSDTASTYEIARIIDIPVILVIDCMGQGNSITAVLEGFLRHRRDHKISGVIFNRISPALYEKAAACVRSLGLVPLGYLPEAEEFKLDHRHLGLVMAQEMPAFLDIAERIADRMEATVDVGGIAKLAGRRPETERPEKREKTEETERPEKREKTEETGTTEKREETETAGKTEKIEKSETAGECSALENPRKAVRQYSCRIAVAQDDAFCFLYHDNLAFLEKRGALLLPFSPISDAALPDCDALYLSGGYPELYAAQLAENESMRRDIADKITSGMPCIAECGGFLYLHRNMETPDGGFCPMVGVIPGDAVRKSRKGHFGYIEVTLPADCPVGGEGDMFRAHEFHYWESTAQTGPETALRVYKPGSGESWTEGVCTETLYAGFPHLYLEGSHKAGEHFLAAAENYGRNRSAHE